MNCWKVFQSLMHYNVTSNSERECVKSHQDMETISSQVSAPLKDRERFNDHPVAGSRAKQLEAQKRSSRLCVGRVIWSELYRDIQKGESSDLIRNNTDIPLYATPTIILDDQLDYVFSCN